jgi:predicted neutral ceramidase superfamily lipid hydrolase
MFLFLSAILEHESATSFEWMVHRYIFEGQGTAEFSSFTLILSLPIMRAVFLPLFTAFLVLTPVSYAASLVTRTGSLVSCLKSSLSPQASVVLPYQSGFAYDTARYSELYAPTFRVISQVAAENDVRISVCTIL